MTLQMNVNWLKRFSKKGTIELTLDELDGLLTDAGQNFQASLQKYSYLLILNLTL